MHFLLKHLIQQQVQQLRPFLSFLSFSGELKQGQLRAVISGSFPALLAGEDLFVILDSSIWLQVSFLKALQELQGDELRPDYNLMDGIIKLFNINKLQIIIKDYAYCCTFHMNMNFFRIFNPITRYRLVVLDKTYNNVTQEHLYFLCKLHIARNVILLLKLY